jgi:hypothetical protein
VSAHGLQLLLAPISLKNHHKLSPNDKDIWDAAYAEEYDGLSSLPTWEMVTEEQFWILSKGRRASPTMAIATIKYDANNCLKRAKYWIVFLGNLDYHTWSKETTAAPVMSQLELRLLTSLAIYNKRVLKNCDVKQAFIQATLPEEKNISYVHHLDVLILNWVNIGVCYVHYMVLSGPPSYGMKCCHLTSRPWVLKALIIVHVYLQEFLSQVNLQSL